MVLENVQSKLAQKFHNRSYSAKVAHVTLTPRRIPNSTSVCKLLSCASSMIITEYDSKSFSFKDSRSKTLFQVYYKASYNTFSIELQARNKLFIEKNNKLPICHIFNYSLVPRRHIFEANSVTNFFSDFATKFFRYSCCNTHCSYASRLRTAFVEIRSLSGRCS